MKSIIFIMLSCLLFLECSKSTKSDKSPCGNGSKFYRTFYASVNYGGGFLSVQVKDKNGTIVNPNSSYIVGYYQSGTPNCNSAEVTALRVELNTGQFYTYTATAPNKKWSGDIGTTCEVNSCQLVELK